MEASLGIGSNESMRQHRRVQSPKTLVLMSVNVNISRLGKVSHCFFVRNS